MSKLILLLPVFLAATAGCDNGGSGGTSGGGGDGDPEIADDDFFEDESCTGEGLVGSWEIDEVTIASDAVPPLGEEACLDSVTESSLEFRGRIAFNGDNTWHSTIDASAGTIHSETSVACIESMTDMGAEAFCDQTAVQMDGTCEMTDGFCVCDYPWAVDEVVSSGTYTLDGTTLTQVYDPPADDPEGGNPPEVSDICVQGNRLVMRNADDMIIRLSRTAG